ncbi:hypothetical protein RIF29_34778 [Crotalaria pallida]|uniref:DUF7795 domain-containing protein n=1 Tax=Crotalaria pallida TaxID=3830 RepID=A0AAN9E978_CROPI
MGKERVVLIDIDIRSEFEIARSTKAYKAILQNLPYIFVGKCDRLQSIVAIVSEVVKQSLKKKGMHVPPWRRVEYVRAKWLSPYTRATEKQKVLNGSNGGGETQLSAENSGEEEKVEAVVVEWKPPELKPKGSISGVKLPYDRITKLDEARAVGGRLLSGFHVALEFIRRPPIDTDAKLVNKIIVANETTRVKSYVNSGCRNPNDGAQSVTNCKLILNELEGLLGDVTSAIQRTHGNLSALSDLDVGVELNVLMTNNDSGENGALSQTTDVANTKTQKNTDVTHLATLMAVMYSMVKQDFLMQERVVSALDLKSPSEELESYCQMWSLRPFINDEIMHQAWELIP